MERYEHLVEEQPDVEQSIESRICKHKTSMCRTTGADPGSRMEGGGGDGRLD